MILLFNWLSIHIYKKLKNLLKRLWACYEPPPTPVGKMVKELIKTVICFGFLCFRDRTHITSSRLGGGRPDTNDDSDDALGVGGVV